MKTMKMIVLALMLCIGALSSISANAAVLVEQVLVNTEREYIAVYDEEFNEVGVIDSYHWQAEIYILDDAEGYLWLIWETPNGYVQETWAIGPNQSYWTKITPGYTSLNSAMLAVINYLNPL